MSEVTAEKTVRKAKAVKTMKDGQIREMVKIALVAAVISILGPFSIPIGEVPVAFANLAILFGVYILGMKKGTVSCILYILLGLVGLPIFSGFQGGPAKLFGPTGGYIVGYIFMAAIAGFFIERWQDKYYMQFIGLVLAIAALYTFGTIWYANLSKCSFIHAFSICVLPFIFGDLIKIIIVIIAGTRLRRRLSMAGIE